MLKKVGLASFIMMSSVFLSRLFGIAREMVIAWLSGTSRSVDAYQISFIIPEILNHVLASGFLSITFIPIFAAYLVKKQEKEAWKVFSNILNTFGIVMIFLILIAMLFTDSFIGITGLSNTGVMTEAIRMTRIIIPAQFFFFAGGLLMAVQFAREKFLFPAMAPLVYNLGIIAGGVLLYPYIGMEGFSWGVLAGAFVGNFLIQLWGAKRVGLTYSLVIKPKHPDIRKYLFLTLPLMLGLTMTFSTEIFPKLFGSYLSPGSVASLNYGLRIMFLLIGIFGQAVGVASYPFLSRLAAEHRIHDMNRLIDTTLRHVSLVIPFSVLVVLLRQEIVQVLFQRGSFGSDSTRVTSEILVYLMIGSFAFTAQTIVNRGYYAMQNTLFPSIYVTVVVLLTLPLYWIGMDYLGIFGVALALSLSTIIQVMTLYILWCRKSGNSGQSAVYILYLKVIAVSLFIGFIFHVLNPMDLIPSFAPRLLQDLTVIVLTSILFVILLLGLAYLFRISEFFEVFRQVSAKIKGYTDRRRLLE